MPTKLPNSILKHPGFIDGYRPNVAAVILNAQNLILWCERTSTPQNWQFPQGGIEPGEEPEQALWREVAEELGLQNPRAILHIEKQLAQTFRYDFPIPVIESFLKKSGISFRGQEQKFFLLRFTGDDSMLTLLPPDGSEREFSNFCWDGPARLKTMASFKYANSQQALREFGLLPKSQLGA